MQLKQSSYVFDCISNILFYNTLYHDEFLKSDLTTILMDIRLCKVKSKVFSHKALISFQYTINQDQS